MKCKYCGNELPQNAAICMKCGRYVPKRNKGIKTLLIIASIFLVILAIAFFSPEKTQTGNEQNSSNVSSAKAEKKEAPLVFSDDVIEVYFKGNLKYEKSISFLYANFEIVNKSGKNLNINITDCSVDDYSVHGMASGIQIQKDKKRVDTFGFNCKDLEYESTDDFESCAFKILVYDENYNEIQTTKEIRVNF